MGDSLSDKRHWANREVLWSEVLVADLKKTYGGEVKLVNTAIGGTLLQQNLILMPRWLKDTPAPDLVTVCFGFNDWDGGMRGEKYKAMLRHAVDRIRRITGGKSEVVLMTTCPAMVVTKPSEGGQPQDRWVCMEELAEAARVVAKEKKTGLADIAAAFHKAGEKAPAREPLYCNDHTHLGKDGHTLVAQTVLEAIQGGGK
jgi:lysophospholipase L1-like esterase